MKIKYCKSTINILCFFISFIFCAEINAQDNLVAAKNNPFLNHLFHSKSEIIEVGNSLQKQHFIAPDAYHINLYTQSLLKNKNGLHLVVNATGRIYRAVELRGDSMYFKRLDTTHFYGYNGNAAYFSYKDTIYNFGGWGFWKANGHLRYYSDFNREWNIKPLNREEALIPTIFYFDKNNGHLYYTGDDKNIAVKNSSPRFPVTLLDLNSNFNKFLGSLNPEIINLLNSKNFLPYPLFIPASGLNGIILLLNHQDHYLFDFEQNKIFKSNNYSIKDILYGNSRGQSAANCFIEDSTLYFTLGNDTSYQLYHTKITRKDFEAEGIPLYIEPVNWQLWGGLGFAGFTAFVLLFIRWKRSQRINTSSVNLLNSILFNEEEAQQSNQFTDGELSVIRFIHDTSLSRKYASVEEVNALLGIGRKTIEVQKKIRTEAISRINHKYRILTDDDQLLVERIRSEEDRRYQKYMIRNENMQKLKSVIK